MSTSIQVENLVAWGEPRELRTVKGPRLLRTGEPTPEFWNAWRRDKESLKAAGVSVKPGHEPGSWEVSWWHPISARTDESVPSDGPVNDPVPKNDASRRDPSDSIFDGRSRAGIQAGENTHSDGVTKQYTPGISGDGASRIDRAVSNVPTAQAVPVTDKVWSDEQKAIFEWFRCGAGNLVVRARAGTGKTTTVKEALSHAPEQEMCYVVFNKRNQIEAQEKIQDQRVDVKTLHSLGYSYVKAVWPEVKPDDDVERDRISSVCGEDTPGEVTSALLKLVAFAKNTTVNPTMSELRDIADERDINAANFEDEENGAWTVGKLAEHAHKLMEASRKKDGANRISFDDMVWLPVAMGWVTSRYDLVVVDECQDMNAPQLLMARGACRPAGRVVVVGDDRQAIYGFRGAFQNAIDVMKERLRAAELGLTTTYRCPKAVVAVAARIVPDYKAAPTAPDGEVAACGEADVFAMVKVGDAVLSRINAPLMSMCLGLLRQGVPARIEGRDIGKALLSIVRKLNAKSVPDFVRRLDVWAAKQRARLAKTTKNIEAKQASITDQQETLEAVAQGCANVGEIEGRLQSLFQDSGTGSKPAVVLSSVHKAKGLEWGTVFTLENTFNRKRPMGVKVSPGEAMEEQNVRYVALTRAKTRLVLVGGGAPAQPRREEKGPRTHGRAASGDVLGSRAPSVPAADDPEEMEGNI